MRIEKLWVIVRSSPTSEFGDICFETDAKGLTLQLKGGLDPEAIHALYTAGNEAQREAERILAASKKYHAVIREVDR